MIRVDRQTVELTDEEMLISDEFEALLDKGYGIHAAVDELETLHANQEIDPAFYAYLRN
jgi:hypothetical protein